MTYYAALGDPEDYREVTLDDCSEILPHTPDSALFRACRVSEFPFSGRIRRGAGQHSGFQQPALQPFRRLALPAPSAYHRSVSNRWMHK